MAGNDGAEPPVRRRAEQRRDAVSVQAEPGADENEVANVRAEGDDAVALGERRLEILQSFDSDFAAGALGIFQLEKAVDQAAREIFLDAPGESFLGRRRVGFAEGSAQIFDDPLARHEEINQQRQRRFAETAKDPRRQEPESAVKREEGRLDETVQKPLLKFFKAHSEDCGLSGAWKQTIVVPVVGRSARVRHSRMLLAGIQPNSDWTPDKNIRG